MKIIAVLIKMIVLIILSPMLIIAGSAEAFVNAFNGDRLPFDFDLHM